MTLPSFETFKAEQHAIGCDEVVERRWEPGATVDTHTHPFSVRALVVQGEMWLTCGTETLHLRPRWLVVRLHTDAGLTGLGEATLEGRCLTVEAALHEMGRWLLGQDPRRIEHIWQHLHRGGFYRGGPEIGRAHV